MHKLLLLISLVLTSNLSNAQTKVSNIFSDHMVLQRDSNVALWGTDLPNTKIEIQGSWGEENETYADEKGSWELKLKTKEAGGPYTLEIHGSEKIQLQDVMLGEVWLCSGQSNMQMPMKGFNGQPVNGSNDLILESTNTNLRLFHVNKNMSKKPLKGIEGTWQQSTPEVVRNFSAVAYMYGKMLQHKLQVPVGIICSSVGGTRIESWTNKETLIHGGYNYDTSTTAQDIDRHTPSVLYNAMIHPLAPYRIKGVIWYQGESNRSNYQQYETLFPAMIQSWRELWNIGEFPFYFVQIAPFSYKPDVNSAYLREAQLHSLKNTKNTGMAITMDIGEEACIHPAKKTEVAKRLLYWALTKSYDFKGIQYSGPLYKSMKVNNNTVELNFDYAPYGVSSFGRELNHFTIAGNDKIFYPAKANIKKGVLTVFSEQVPHPVAVRYAWENYVEGCLFNLAGLPASSFRTDHWEK